MTRQLQPQSGSTDRRTGTHTALIAVALLGMGILGGCATSKDELMPTHGVTMKELWKQGTAESAATDASEGSTPQGVDAARGALRRPIGPTQMTDERTRYTREAANEIHSQFSRLPNPDLVIYIYPHLAGNASMPVPGYSSVFPLHDTPQYAMPGEGARPTGRTR